MTLPISPKHRLMQTVCRMTANNLEGELGGAAL